jgi:hypothetical protein
MTTSPAGPERRHLVAYAWQGCYATVLYDKSQPVAHANLKEGRNSWVGTYGISSKTTATSWHLPLDDKLATPAATPRSSTSTTAA